MRILNVTASYFPFEEFGGPPVKVRALAEQMVKRKHETTVLTIDWGLQRRERWNDVQRVSLPAERSPFGWRKLERGIEVNYLRRGLNYRTLSWTRNVKPFSRTRLESFAIVHIFGLYDLLGPKVAAACRAASTPYVVEPMGMAVPIVRSLQLKRMYHRVLGQPMLQGAAAIVATSAQEVVELKS